ncbi:hypothetical protein [Campylobacter corcagiensis]|uniref:Protein hydE n=1 Tax=Campylobacter corcagiensis TaxID=1448857 RepID=A0A7M1LEW7_9BACT|nr:hypothetical protein [Campylobacter corcagiensis]QKF64738.1 hypothetical protein CCORG_0884 [Campylobacter corcagiensis]QOQ87098.1 hypothetical protein IMC76_07755 [Campylobacter corcagiensis]
MILAYKFEYTHKIPYLAYFLDYYAKKSNLKYTITFKNSEIILYVDASEDELLKFSDESMNLIPNSIFLSKSSVEVTDQMPSFDVKIPDTKFSSITPFMIKNSKSNEYGIFSEVSVFKDSKFTLVNEENFSEILEFCKLNLTHNQPLKFKDKNGEFIMENGLNFSSNFIMPTSFLNINKAFVADEKTLICLASFEKPIITLKLNSIFRDNHKNAPMFFDVKGASDFFIFSLLNALNKDEIFFISVKTEHKGFKILVQDDEILVINGGNFSFENKSCDVEISDNVYYKGAKSLVKFSEILSFDELENMIKADDTGLRLFNNFSKNFRFPSGSIKDSTDFLLLLDMASLVLFGKNRDYLFEMASDFLGQKGPRIDCFINELKFDTVKFIRSGMSFKLAGVDDRLLSYGYIESLMHFFDDFIGDIKDELDIKSVLLKGEIFTQKAGAKCAKKILSKSLDVRYKSPLNDD